MSRAAREYWSHSRAGQRNPNISPKRQGKTQRLYGLDRKLRNHLSRPITWNILHQFIYVRAACCRRSIAATQQNTALISTNQSDCEASACQFHRWKICGLNRPFISWQRSNHERNEKRQKTCVGMARAVRVTKPVLAVCPIDGHESLVPGLCSPQRDCSSFEWAKQSFAEMRS